VAAPRESGEVESHGVTGWRFARFDDLSPREIHDLYRLRAAVFVVEQECAFQDLDGADLESWHLLGYRPSSRPSPQGEGALASSPLGEGRGEGSQLAAYARLVAPGVKYEEPSIGRIVTAQAVRRTGLGRELVREALARAEQLWPGRAIRIGAQQRLERFYREFGFVTASAPYDEDGIPHVEMLRPATRAKAPRGETVGR
jgi:ElaA protein